MESKLKSYINFQITSDVPLPPKSRTGNKTGKRMLPIELLQVGESFVVPFRDGEDVNKGYVRVYSLLHQTKNRILGKDTERKFVCAIEQGGYRIWRKI